MPSREELQKRLLATFRAEAAEHVESLQRELAAILSPSHAAPRRDHLETLFRVMHTLKGAARSVRAEAIEQICQEGEVLLRSLVHGQASATEADLAMLKRSTERLHDLLFAETLDGAPAAPAGPPPAPAMAASPPAATPSDRTTAEAPAPGSAPAPTPGSVPAAAGAPSADAAAAEEPEQQRYETVRVDVGRLDRLVLAAEELLMPSLITSERARTAKKLAEDIRQFRAEMRALSGKAVENPGRLLRTLTLGTLKEIETGSRQLATALSDDQRTLRSLVADLFAETRRARMMPAAAMLAAFPAMVRDICRETGKQAKWHLKDPGVELDRKVIELVKDPLIHLVRNAIDHGIEAPDDREAAGKPRRGRIALSIAGLEGSKVSITVTDDGRGMNLAGLKEAAVRSRNLTAVQAKTLGDDEVIDLAFRAGVSTSPVITSISGLGLGLAIVREQVERIDGTVAVKSIAGQGTTISLVLPATIASYRGLLVGVGNTRLLLPAESVERVVGVPRSGVTAALQTGMLPQGGETLPFARLASILETAAGPLSDARRLFPCAIVTNGPRRAAFLVDEILGETDVLVKDLPLPLRRVRNISAAGLLGSGDLVLIARPSDLLVAVHSRRSVSHEVEAAGAGAAIRVLIVDDSITTRTMEKNLFEAAGYAVTTAVDGMDAWSILQTRDVDLVVSDIDMPRMNGFDLTAQIRADNRLAETPVVLVTALESREDKERGIRIGANAYVLKSSFDQTNLLEIVGRLI
ncbi:MAG TPA: response regulator [Dongiaceae bacterium]|nr:response regulator [Dongiaceae bacterium]